MLRRCRRGRPRRVGCHGRSGVLAAPRLGRHGDAGDAFLQKVNVRGPGMSKAASLFGLGAGAIPVPEEDVAVVDDVACGALGCGLAD